MRFGAIQAPKNVIWAQEIFPIVIYSSKYMYILCPTNSSWGPQSRGGRQTQTGGNPPRELLNCRRGRRLHPLPHAGARPATELWEVWKRGAAAAAACAAAAEAWKVIGVGRARALPASRGAPAAAAWGSGRIVVSDMEVPNMLANLV